MSPSRVIFIQLFFLGSHTYTTPPSSALLTSNPFLVALKIATLPLRYEQFIILIMLSHLTQSILRVPGTP